MYKVTADPPCTGRPSGQHGSGFSRTGTRGLRLWPFVAFDVGEFSGSNAARIRKSCSGSEQQEDTRIRPVLAPNTVATSVTSASPPSTYSISDTLS